MMKFQFNRSDRRIMLRFAIAAVVAFGIVPSLFSNLRWGDIAGTGRRPLVLVAGQTQQIATTDYLSSIGGVTANAIAAAAGDIETTTETVSSTLTVAGDTTTGAFNAGVLAASLTASQNDWNPAGLQTARYIKATAVGQANLTGITAPTGSVSGRELCIENVGSSSITFVDQSSLSIVANRFAMQEGTSWQLLGLGSGANGGTFCFFYDSTISRWVHVNNQHFPTIQVGSSGAFTVSSTGATATSTESLGGFANVQGATASVLAIANPTTFATSGSAMSSFNINCSNTSTRTSGTGVLTNICGSFTATGAQVNNALVTNDGDVLLNQTSGAVKIGSTPQIISTGTPAVNHGSLGTGSTNWDGDVTGIGGNTSVTLTYSVAFPNRSRCLAQVDSVVIPETIHVTNSASAPQFNCIDMAGSAANCDNFSYHCTGQ